MEVGWTLAREAWGKGFATEAARAAMDYAFTRMDIAKLLSVIHHENAPSQRVAERIGERKGAPAPVEYNGEIHPCDAWEITREEWAAKASTQ